MHSENDEFSHKDLNERQSQIYTQTFLASSLKRRVKTFKKQTKKKIMILDSPHSTNMQSLFAAKGMRYIRCCFIRGGGNDKD